MRIGRSITILVCCACALCDHEPIAAAEFKERRLSRRAELDLDRT